jgi:hypothetical protein
MGHELRSNGLLNVEVSQDRVSSLASRLAEVQWRMVRMAPSRRLRRSQVEDGRVDKSACIRLFYHIFTIFNVSP